MDESSAAKNNSSNESPAPKHLSKALKAWNSASGSEGRPSQSTYDKAPSALKLSKTYPEPSNEFERLAYLKSFDIFDTAHDESFENLTRLTAKLFDCPVTLVSLLDDHRQWFKSNYGLPARETPKDQAFCCYAIEDNAPPVLVIPDAQKDDRFKNNPLVTGDPRIRFYAGAPLILDAKRGIKAGTLCVIDRKPRPEGLTEDQRIMLKHLAQCTVDILRAHKLNVQQHRTSQSISAENSLVLGAFSSMETGAMIVDSRTLAIVYASPGILRLFTLPATSIIGQPLNKVLQVMEGDDESVRQLEGLVASCRLRSQTRATLQIRKPTIVSEALRGKPVPLWIQARLVPIVVDPKNVSLPTSSSVQDSNSFSLMEVSKCDPNPQNVLDAQKVQEATAATHSPESSLLTLLQNHGSRLVEVFTKVREPLNTLVGVSKKLESNDIDNQQLSDLTKEASQQIAQLFDGMVRTVHEDILKLTPTREGESSKRVRLT